VAKALRDTKENTVYVDCNAISPLTSKKLNDVIKGVGSRYVDASIIGPPPRRKGLTKFYASGPNVSDFEVLTKYGLEVRRLGLEIGQGKGIKMVYAALTKGLTAISTQLLISARRMDLYENLIDLFMETQSVQYERMKRSVTSMPSRSRRWVSEMEEISKTFEYLGTTPKIYQGAADLYRVIGETSLADVKDRDKPLDQIIEILSQEID
jgi:3-hydroxyisobutyrate dehydrogenase-like beta-hydroxyacid dehydrogenase